MGYLLLRLAHKHKVDIDVKDARLVLHLHSGRNEHTTLEPYRDRHSRTGNGFLALDNIGCHVVELTTWFISRGEMLPNFWVRFYTGAKLYGKGRWFPFFWRELYSGGRKVGSVEEGGAYLTITDHAGQRMLANDCELTWYNRYVEEGWLEKGIAANWPSPSKPSDCEETTESESSEQQQPRREAHHEADRLRGALRTAQPRA